MAASEKTKAFAEKNFLVYPIPVTGSPYCGMDFESSVCVVVKNLLICKFLNFMAVFTKKIKVSKVCIQFSVRES